MNYLTDSHLKGPTPKTFSDGVGGTPTRQPARRRRYENRCTWQPGLNLAARLRDLLDLEQVVQVVARHHPHNMVDGFFAALLVLAVVLP
jgi:hypothetical protein